VFMQSFLKGLAVWAQNVLPALFPFAALTPLALKYFPHAKLSLCAKLFGVRADGAYLASLLCGYPVGAKAVSESNLDGETCAQMCSFCSSASPVFVIVTVGGLLGNNAATAVLVVSHLLSTLLNGLLYRAKRNDGANTANTATFTFNDVGNALTSAVLSVLLVGGLIALFFMLIDMAKSLLPQWVGKTAALGFAFGLLEMTSGVISVCATCETFAATVLCCFLISFGGMCVFAQSMAFLAKRNVKPQKFLQMKATQGAIATLLGFALGKMFL
ncbi:MAG: hypothetical protein ACI4QH_03690, partial [Candidatus Fimimonas sp.]